MLPPAEQYLEVGYNFRMTDLQAAVGIVQLGRLDAVVARRRELAARYREALADVAGLRLVDDPPHGEVQLPVVLGRGRRRRSRSAARSCSRIWRTPTSRLGAASWPSIANRHTRGRARCRSR